LVARFLCGALIGDPLFARRLLDRLPRRGAVGRLVFAFQQEGRNADDRRQPDQRDDAGGDSLLDHCVTCWALLAGALLAEASPVGAVPAGAASAGAGAASAGAVAAGGGAATCAGMVPPVRSSRRVWSSRRWT